MKIYIATHKKYTMPSDHLYQPLMVGSALRDEIPQGYQRDDQGPNISTKNPNFNELTGIYWIWKNSAEDVVGLVHYRRYLGQKGGHDLANRFDQGQIQRLLTKVDVILPKQRNYYIENQRDHYLNAHAQAPYLALEQVIRENFPEYYPGFQQVEKSTKAHLFNMMIMKKEVFDDYAGFVFAVLGKVEEAVDLSTLTGQDLRVFGFLSERLMDTWLNTRHYTYQDVPVISLEKTNWFDKGTQFLKRKFFPNTKKKVHF